MKIGKLITVLLSIFISSSILSANPEKDDIIELLDYMYTDLKSISVKNNSNTEAIDKLEKKISKIVNKNNELKLNLRHINKEFKEQKKILNSLTTKLQAYESSSKKEFPENLQNYYDSKKILKSKKLKEIENF